MEILKLIAKLVNLTTIGLQVLENAFVMLDGMMMDLMKFVKNVIILGLF